MPVFLIGHSQGCKVFTLIITIFSLRMFHVARSIFLLRLFDYIAKSLELNIASFIEGSSDHLLLVYVKFANQYEH